MFVCLCVRACARARVYVCACVCHIAAMGGGNAAAEGRDLQLISLPIITPQGYRRRLETSRGCSLVLQVSRVEEAVLFACQASSVLGQLAWQVKISKLFFEFPSSRILLPHPLRRPLYVVFLPFLNVAPLPLRKPCAFQKPRHSFDSVRLLQVMASSPFATSHVSSSTVSGSWVARCARFQVSFICILPLSFQFRSKELFYLSLFLLSDSSRVSSCLHYVYHVYVYDDLYELLKCVSLVLLKSQI